MTPRRLLVLIRSLPPDSALARTINPDQWDASAYLLALAVDALNGANWQRAGDGKAKRPKPVTRPGEEEARAGKVASAAAAFKARQQTQGGA